MAALQMAWVFTTQDSPLFVCSHLGLDMLRVDKLESAEEASLPMASRLGGVAGKDGGQQEAICVAYHFSRPGEFQFIEADRT